MGERYNWSEPVRLFHEAQAEFPTTEMHRDEDPAANR